jgi:hypothetical protein
VADTLRARWKGWRDLAFQNWWGEEWGDGVLRIDLPDGEPREDEVGDQSPSQ